LAAPDPRIRGGMFAAVEFLGNDSDGRVPAVPIDAVTILDGQDVVFVPTDAENTFRPVPVTLGRRAAGLVELRDGVKPGESAAVSGVFTIKSALCSDQIGDDNAD
jgi:cobalt-zinc-cadmium efflux system membrane fusion protein